MCERPYCFSGYGGDTQRYHPVQTNGVHIAGKLTIGGRGGSNANGNPTRFFVNDRLNGQYMRRIDELLYTPLVGHASEWNGQFLNRQCGQGRLMMRSWGSRETCGGDQDDRQLLSTVNEFP